MKQYTVTEPFLKTSCGVGESLHYEPSTTALSFIDVPKRELHTVDLSRGPDSHRVISDLALKPHKLVDVQGRKDIWLCGSKYGFAVMDRKSGKMSQVARIWTDEEMSAGKGAGVCTNDGAIDSQGRFWLGSISDPLNLKYEEGAVYRLDPDLTVHTIIPSGHSVLNGMSWSPDNKIMYITDSNTGIHAYDFNAATGAISNKRLFLPSAGAEGGAPDGHAMDVEGHLWVALFGGGKVVRVSPGGEVVAEIRLPTRCITDVAFVGEEVFIVTAGEWFPDRYPESVKLAGAVFRCEVGIKGLPANEFGLPGAEALLGKL